MSRELYTYNDLQQIAFVIFFRVQSEIAERVEAGPCYWYIHPSVGLEKAS